MMACANPRGVASSKRGGGSSSSTKARACGLPPLRSSSRRQQQGNTRAGAFVGGGGAVDASSGLGAASSLISLGVAGLGAWWLAREMQQQVRQTFCVVVDWKRSFA